MQAKRISEAVFETTLANLLRREPVQTGDEPETTGFAEVTTTKQGLVVALPNGLRFRITIREITGGI